MSAPAPKARPWWRLHASSYLVAVVVLAICGAMNLGAEDVGNKPSFGWPIAYLSVDAWLDADPFGDPFVGPAPLWLWRWRPEQTGTWRLAPLALDAGVLLVILAATVGGWEWRRRHRRRLWQFTLLDLLALTTFVGLAIV